MGGRQTEVEIAGLLFGSAEGLYTNASRRSLLMGMIALQEYTFFPE
jgi:hypothetical protein